MSTGAAQSGTLTTSVKDSATWKLSEKQDLGKIRQGSDKLHRALWAEHRPIMLALNAKPVTHPVRRGGW